MSPVLVEREGRLALVKLNRPEVLNALSSALLEELDETLRALEDCDVVIVTGSGKAFAAGADIAEISKMTPGEWEDYLALGNRVMDRIERAPFVVIAAVNGYALGGGLELALACDLILADQEAFLGLPEASLGLMPSFGGVKRLTRLVGPLAAKELMLTGKSLSAHEAIRVGLVNRVCSGSSLLPECRTFAKEIQNNSQEAVVAIKRSVVEDDPQRYHDCFASEECKKRLAAFLEKR